jgi:tRNA (guanine-N7-)-methyltransferase
MKPPIKSFVLRAGRISRAQQRSYQSGKQFIIPYSEDAADFPRYFGNEFPITVEIGFGMGEVTAEIAAANPGNNYLGIEVYRAGIGKLLWEIEQRHLSNVRIIEHDAVEAVGKMFPTASIAAFHLFFPDPWPKKRHHKRRIIQTPFAELLASRLVDGGYIYMVTDWENYAEHALAVFSAIPGLHNPSGTAFAEGLDWRPRSKFEAKGIAKNHRIREIYSLRRC